MLTILVPIDFTETSQKGLDYALALAKADAARIVLINLWNFPENHPSMSFILHDVLRDQNEKSMHDLIEKIKRENQNKQLTLEGIVDVGNVVAIIKNTAKKVKADLIIMGTEGATGFKELFVGSNAAEVMENAPCPILAVPSEMNIEMPKKIVFATNLDKDDINRLKNLLDWFKPFESVFYIIHIGDPNYKDLNDFEDFIVQAKEKLLPKTFNYAYLPHRNVQQGIQDYITTNKIDLLSMAIRKHSFFQQILNRSLTKKMAYHTAIPLMAFPIFKKAEKQEEMAEKISEVAY